MEEQTRRVWREHYLNDSARRSTAGGRRVSRLAVLQQLLCQPDTANGAPFLQGVPDGRQR
jgi:hypothetical protein